MHCSSRAFDFFAYLAVAAAAFILGDPPLQNRGSVIHVSPRGSDWMSGSSPEQALRSIQRAADLARAGDCILIQPGIYYERVHVRRGGAQENPVTFKAAEPGTVIISGALPESMPPHWMWTEEGDGIYSTTTQAPVYTLSCGDELLFRVPWGGVHQLRELIRRSTAWGAFYYANRRLYVFLRGKRHPGRSPLITHAAVPEPREWGEFKSANVWVEADHVAFSGLRFEMGIGAGVLVWNAEDVTVHDCAFHGATFGVKCGVGIKPARHVRVENCFYHNFPQYFWHRDWLSWSECYAAYASSSLISAVDDGTRVTNNLVTHAGDALRISTHDVPIDEGIEISGNWLAFCTDDAIELDGHAKHVWFRRNLVFECHENVSASPVLSGPVVVEDNLFLHPSGGINGAQLKLIPPVDMSNPLKALPIRNVELRRNVAFGNWLCWSSPGPIQSVQIHDNVFSVSRQTKPAWPIGVTTWNNVLSQAPEHARTVNEMLQCLRGATHHDPDFAALVEANAQHLQARPGPRWLDWGTQPAVRPLRALVGDPSP